MDRFYQSYGYTAMMHADATCAPACQSACHRGTETAAASILSVLGTAVLAVSILILCQVSLVVLLSIITMIILLAVRILYPCMVKP